MPSQLHVFEAEVTSALVTLDISHMQMTPLHRPEHWTVQQTVEHLLLTYRHDTETLSGLLNRRPPTLPSASPTQRVRRIFILVLRRFPAGVRTGRKLEPSRPASLRTGAELAERVHQELEKLAGLIAAAEYRYASRRIVPSPLLGPLSAVELARYHCVHGWHHLRQIVRTLSGR